MTYCLGWKTENYIILAADTALTSSDKIREIEQSSFGEQHIQFLNGKVVEERALKIFHFKNFILTYTGSTRLAYSIAAVLRDELSRQTPPREAIKRALAVNIAPCSSDESIILICGFYEDEKLVLLSVHPNENNIFQEHDSLVQFGSVFGQVKELTHDYLEQCIDEDDDISVKTAKLLGVLQYYSKMGPLMESKAGGAFSAISLSPQDICWQPDILYLLHSKNKENNKIVSVCVREDCLISCSPTLSQNRCFSNYVSLGETPKQASIRCARAYRSGIEQHNSGKFNYIIIHNIDFPVVVIVRMNHKLKHELIWIQPTASGDLRGLKTYLHANLLKLILYPWIENGRIIPTVHYRNYERPTQDNPIAKYWNGQKETEWINSQDGKKSFPKI